MKPPLDATARGTSWSIVSAYPPAAPGRRACASRWSAASGTADRHHRSSDASSAPERGLAPRRRPRTVLSWRRTARRQASGEARPEVEGAELQHERWRGKGRGGAGALRSLSPGEHRRSGCALVPRSPTWHQGDRRPEEPTPARPKRRRADAFSTASAAQLDRSLGTTSDLATHG